MRKLLYSELKELRERFNFDRFELEDFVYSTITNEEEDFVVGNYRFIEADMIDEIMQKELESDEYMLGCFNAWFLADVLDIDQDVIDEMQKAEAYTAIGKLVLSMGKLKELQEQYVSADGYGIHFNGYDGTEDEISFSNMPSYYVFRE